MKIGTSTLAVVFTVVIWSLSAVAQTPIRQEFKSMQTVHLHIDGFMKSKSGAT